MAGRKIPGFEDEYTGEPGFEKSVHKTHFEVPKKKIKKSSFESGYNWVEIRPGRWRLVKSHPDRSETESVRDAPEGGGEHGLHIE